MKQLPKTRDLVNVQHPANVSIPLGTFSRFVTTRPQTSTHFIGISVDQYKVLHACEPNHLQSQAA